MINVYFVFSLILLLPAGSRGLRGLIVAGRILVCRGWVGGGVGMGGDSGAGIGEWVADSGNGIGELVARESGCGKREFGIRRNPEFAEFGNRKRFRN